MMRSQFLLPAALCLLTAGAPQAAVLSDNLVQGGDFEDAPFLKTVGSLDVLDNYIPVHRFNQDADLGMWLAKWGPPSQDGGFGGFSLYDDPRDVTETGGDTRISGDLGNVNRSVDPLNPANHILEPVMFRPRWGQWIEAPANHVPGPISFSFDYMLGGDWLNADDNNWGYVWLMGLNQLPTHNLSYTTDGDPNAALTPLGGDQLEYDGTSRGDVLIRMVYGDWMEPAFTAAGKPYFDTWHTVSSDDPDPLFWGDLEDPDNDNELTVNLDQTYPYYAIIFYSIVYGETDPRFWLYAPDALISDTFAQGFDNFSLQLSVEEEDVPDPLPGDFSIDGLVNTEDINPFILALTDTTAWLNYARPLLPGGLLDQQIIDIPDANGDGVINTEDIAWFICWLTTPGSCGGGGGGAIIPEPASLSLLGLGALALIRRRR